MWLNLRSRSKPPEAHQGISSVDICWQYYDRLIGKFDENPSTGNKIYARKANNKNIRYIKSVRGQIQKICMYNIFRLPDLCMYWWCMYYHTYIHNIYRMGQKSKPAYFCNNCVCCQPIFIIFGTYTLVRLFRYTGVDVASLATYGT